MFTKEKLQNKNSSNVWVTFSMPAIEGCSCLYLVGKFDDWNESVYRMERMSDGSWSLVLELEPGCDYHYCYRTDNGVWHIDPVADSYVPTSDGLERSIVRL